MTSKLSPVMHAQNMDQVEQKIQQEPPVFEIRVFGDRLSAGFPSPATDYLENTLDLNQYLIHNKAATFIFTVKGDSMIDASIEDGDKVIVDRSIKARHRHIVVAVVNNEYTIKRFYKYAGRIELHPENPRYSAITFSEGSELQIWGVVIGVVRRYTNKADL